MATNLIKRIAPVRERRVKWENDSKGVLEILDAGSKKAQRVAQGTVERVREAVFGWGKKRAEIGGGGEQAAGGGRGVPLDARALTKGLPGQRVKKGKGPCGD